MPRINLRIINILLILSFICFSVARRNRYAAAFSDALSLITEHHLYATEQDARELFDSAMHGMVGTLDKYDRHSAYMDPAYFEEFRNRTDQNFFGVGFRFEFDEKEKRPRITTPLPNSPALRAGLTPGDLIVAIDGTDTKNLDLDKAKDLIKGLQGTQVKLTIRREGEEELLDIMATRDSIRLDSVYGDTRKADGTWRFTLSSHPEIGYIRLESFGDRTKEELRDAIQSLEGKPIRGLVLDLRQNPGGLLDAAVDVCNLFIDEGKIVTIHDKENKEHKRHEASSGNTLFPGDIPIVVLIDGNSASASEIVAACLQDHGRAKVAGERSWGKGTVQEVFPLEGGRSALKLTISRYHRPNGKNIHRNMRDANGNPSNIWGVRPDKGLKLKLEAEDLKAWLRDREDRNVLYPAGHPIPEPETTRVQADPQLEMAVEHLLK